MGIYRCQSGPGVDGVHLLHALQLSAESSLRSAQRIVKQPAQSFSAEGLRTWAVGQAAERQRSYFGTVSGQC